MSAGGNLTQGRQPLRALIVESGEKDVPLAVLSRKWNKKESRETDAL